MSDLRKTVARALCAYDFRVEVDDTFVMRPDDIARWGKEADIAVNTVLDYLIAKATEETPYDAADWLESLKT